jgi:ABC-type antimicrobial peptide transport system permease subunit
MIAKLNPERVAKESIAKIETLYKQNDPTLPFTYEFVDESYAKKFGNEERVGKLAGFFAILAIGISCLGLFGLASFMAEQRTKEIGLRKVLGASVYNVWQLLSKDFVFLVLISFLISAPLTYWLMHNWLQNFDYRATISWWIFVIAGMGSLFITICVVSFQSIKAALANPIKSLRTE